MPLLLGVAALALAADDADAAVVVGIRLGIAVNVV